MDMIGTRVEARGSSLCRRRCCCCVRCNTETTLPSLYKQPPPQPTYQPTHPLNFTFHIIIRTKKMGCLLSGTSYSLVKRRGKSTESPSSTSNNVSCWVADWFTNSTHFRFERQLTNLAYLTVPPCDNTSVGTPLFNVYFDI